MAAKPPFSLTTIYKFQEMGVELVETKIVMDYLEFKAFCEHFIAASANHNLKLAWLRDVLQI
jgi:hypothetical protein